MRELGEVGRSVRISGGLMPLTHLREGEEEGKLSGSILCCCVVQGKIKRAMDES